MGDNSQCDLLILTGFFLAELNMIVETLLFEDSIAVLASKGLQGCFSMFLSLMVDEICLVMSYKTAARLSAL